MLKPHEIILQLELNGAVFKSLLDTASDGQITYRPTDSSWCLLEIVCHLFDEEREDFRARVDKALHFPNDPLIAIDPAGWVAAREYMKTDFRERTMAFFDERKRSVAFLKALKDPDWDSYFEHPELGKLSARHFLYNWLAHDYLHMRQITHRKFQYLQANSPHSLDYAGSW